jgi:hypothetical protein
MNFESKKHLQVEEQIVFFGKAAWWPLRWLGSRRSRSCINKSNAISIIVMLTRLRCIG